MKQLTLRNLSGLIITILYLMGQPALSQAAVHGKTASASKSSPATKPGKIFRDCNGCPEMVVIHSGSFDMGSTDNEDGRSKDEGPVHRVKIANFAIGKYEVTRGQFAAFVKATKYITGDKCQTLVKGNFEEHKGDWRAPGYPQENIHPVVCINWDDATAYAKWLSHKSGKKYRLPTESEWEYAARGRTTTAHYWGNNPADACQYANGADKTAQAKIQGAQSWLIHDCTDGYVYTAPVGKFKPNAFGLYDMLGNVWEWTADNYHDAYTDAPSEGSAWQGNGVRRVLRGGSWNNSPKNLRAATRYASEHEVRFSSFGFRLARQLP